MIGREAIPRQGELSALHRLLNRLQAEIKRLGNIRGSGGIEITSNAAGVFVSGGEAGRSDMRYAKLLEQVNRNGKGTAQLIEVDNPPDGNWIDTVGENNQITVYAPPILGVGQYYPVGSTVGVVYVSAYQRYVIINSLCGGCY